MQHPLSLYRQLKISKYKELYQNFFYPDEKVFLIYDKYDINFELRTKNTSIYLTDIGGDQYLSESFLSFDETLKKLLKTYHDEIIVNINHSLAFIFEKKNKQYFLNSIISELIQLVDEFMFIKNTHIYGITKSSILTLINNIIRQENYKPDRNITSKILKANNLIHHEKGSFHMKQTYFDNISFLFSALIENNFVSPETKLEDFSNAFTHHNKAIDRKLISWIAKSKSSQSSKPLLLFFIDLLMNQNIVSLEKPSVIKNVIVSLFANQDGSNIAIEKLRVASSQKNKNNKTKTIQQGRLESIINDFLSKS